MNYLAHAYLSFRQPGLLVGNMISDFVKGKKQYDYPLPVFKGIRLHRAIDDFTDHHEATRQAKQYFRPAYRLYAGAFTDVIFDHFLANDAAVFTNEKTLALFATDTYQTLSEQFNLLPQRFQAMLPHMQQHNWLLNYRYPEGIRQSLGGLVSRSAYLTDSATAFQILQDNYVPLQQCYQVLFPQLIQMAQTFIEEES